MTARSLATVIVVRAAIVQDSWTADTVAKIIALGTHSCLVQHEFNLAPRSTFIIRIRPTIDEKCELLEENGARDDAIRSFVKEKNLAYLKFVLHVRFFSLTRREEI